MIDEPLRVLDRAAPGPVEPTKRAVIRALREALLGTGLSENDNDLHIDMEYPYKEEQYPSIWVQFSLSSLQSSGLAHVTKSPEGKEIQQWMYDGRVTLTIVALSSLERDRISDRLISLLAFSKAPLRADGEEGPLGRPHKTFFGSLTENPYVAITPNLGTLSPGGQSTTMGTAWQNDKPAYEDSYSFTLHGEFNAVYERGQYRLSRIDIVPELIPPTPAKGEWI